MFEPSTALPLAPLFTSGFATGFVVVPAAPAVGDALAFGAG